jgi:hypothetical protein
MSKWKNDDKIYIVNGIPNISVNNEMMKASVSPYERQSNFFGFAKKTVKIKEATNMEAKTISQFPYQSELCTILIHLLFFYLQERFKYTSLSIMKKI